MAISPETNLNNSFATADTPSIAIGVTTAPTLMFPESWTVADFQAHLGDIPAERIRLSPKPGCATEDDLIYLQDTKQALCELVDGILVEKPVGHYESAVAMTIGALVKSYVQAKNLGVVTGEGGGVRTIVPQVRMPDVGFVSRERFPDRKVPRKKILPVSPDLAIEVLSESNTRKEMARKLLEYFQGGTRLVWYIDPETRTAELFTSPSQVTRITEDGILDGTDVLPGFQVRLKDVFENAGPFDD
jgi:Uma2 family endonuclease